MTAPTGGDNHETPTLRSTGPRRRRRLAIGRRRPARADRAEVQPHRPARRRAPEGRAAVRARRSSNTPRAATRCRSTRPASWPTTRRRWSSCSWVASTSPSPAPAPTPRTCPTLNLSLLPYLVENYEQGWKLYDESKWLKEQFAKAPAKGFRFVATWEAGFRNMTTKEPLNSPADAKGKKLRSFPNEMMRWTLEAIGFNVRHHAAARGLPGDPAGRGQRPGKPDRHDLRQQVLRGRAERHADPPCLQPDPADDLGEDLAEADARPTRRR